MNSLKFIKLSKLLARDRVHISVSYFLVSVILLNSIINIFNDKKLNFFLEINFFDITSGLFLFTFLLNMGMLIKNSFKFDSISISIVFYLFSFFVIDCLILFFYKEFSFLELVLVINIFWIFLILIKSKNIKGMVPAIISFVFLKTFVNLFKSRLTVNNNLIGDVNAVFYDQAKNIYENSYYYSINNFVFEGYPQFISYIQSLFLGISSDVLSYNFFAYTSHIVFYLSILFFAELNISRLNKFFIISLFSLLIFNSHFLKLLISTSLMSEGLVNLFTAITTVAVLDNVSKHQRLDTKLFFIFGIMYFSKQFNSSLVIISLLILLLITKLNKTVFIGFFGFIMKEMLYLFVFQDIEKDHHIKQMDVLDTVLDLILLRDLKIENFILILKNLWIDKPIVILFFVFYFVFLYSKIINKKFDLTSDLIFLIINLNIIFVFLLYISVWRNMELESPIRYFLNYFQLIIISIFLEIDKHKKHSK